MTAEVPIVATAVCATVLIARIPAFLNQSFQHLFIFFTTFHKIKKQLFGITKQLLLGTNLKPNCDQIATKWHEKSTLFRMLLFRHLKQAPIDYVFTSQLIDPFIGDPFHAVHYPG
nr:MAG TPA: hypothetical protein [Caudoviricetes sp.]